MKVLSLFDGISCGMIALQRAGITVEKYVAYEINEYAKFVSLKNYPQIVQYGDVITADFTKHKNCDLLIGGSPCTYWSIAKGKMREITPQGIGGELFLAYIRALKETNCKWFLYENNYSIHNNIKDFISTQLGVKPMMINSALVSAQQRKRCYWTNIPNIVQPTDKKLVVKDILEEQLSNYNKYRIPSCYRPVFYDKNSIIDYNKPIRIGEFGNGGQGQRIYSVFGKSVTLSANGGGQGAKTGLYKIVISDDKFVVRRLSPVEAERLQTLPDNYTEGVSETQRYKCIGNGWTVDVISHILSFLK